MDGLDLVKGCSDLLKINTVADYVPGEMSGVRHSLLIQSKTII